MGSPYDKEPCCGISLLKYILFIFNFFLLLGGAGVTGIGLWTLLKKWDYASLLCDDLYTIATWVLIIVGGIVIIIAALGCFGAQQEQKCCLLIYFTLLLLLCLGELLVGIYTYIYRDRVNMELERCLNSTLVANYGMPDQEDYSKGVDNLQRKFYCCGASGYADYQQSLWKVKGKAGNLSSPDSCCKTESSYCAVRDHPSNIYHLGCVDGLTNYFSGHLAIIGAVCMAIAGVQIFGLVFSMCLYCHLRYEEQEPY
ncbi:CD151 antigen-like [Acanthaster planci]|uniref:Tetraspanin n=1 Tax=Acanthaster planci TaxID=133434 RepID=A0A8B7XRY5_ACAPL|nr:CD151 antigen-like [Acanthaster planci]XP_022082760.1 CD151 antigen-like [Acanthaster planci]